MMSSTVKGTTKVPINKPGKLRIAPAANDNIPLRIIRDTLRENEQRVQQGDTPIRQQLAFWRAFTPDQVRYAQHIYSGFLRLYGGSVRTQDYAFMPRGKSPQAQRSTLSEELFSRWARAGITEGVDLTAILEILIFGLSCRQVDKKHGRRKGFAKENLVLGLELYADLKSKHTKIEKTT